MKNLFMVLLTIACGAVLFVGNLHWKERTTVSGADAEPVAAEKEDAEEETADDIEAMAALAANWPEKAVEGYRAALDENRPFRIIFAGSPVMNGDSWTETVVDELEKAFGDTVEVEVKVYETTSRQFVEKGEHEKLAAENADFIIWEPFTLTDNGYVRIEHSHEYIDETIAAIVEENADAVVVLQPPYPIYGSKFYPVQVEALKRYAEKNGIPYLNHWEAWPDINDAELKDYLGKDNVPNEKGHEIWANYILNYLIAQ